jgi:hypothetical protein
MLKLWITWNIWKGEITNDLVRKYVAKENDLDIWLGMQQLA